MHFSTALLHHAGGWRRTLPTRAHLSRGCALLSYADVRTPVTIQLGNVPVELREIAKDDNMTKSGATAWMYVRVLIRWEGGCLCFV